MAHDTQARTVTDPDCGMAGDLATAKSRSEYEGQAYVFCSLMCQKAFEDAPRHLRNKGPRSDAGS